MSSLKRSFLIVLLSLLVVAVIPAAADESLFNPSFYSAAEIAAELPSFWIANYIEVIHLVSNYPDMTCEYYEDVLLDQVVCVSVNNARTRDVIINFFFDGDYAGMKGLKEAVFTITTPQTSDVQEVLEYYWLPGAFPCHTKNDEFYNFQSLVFHTSDTVMRVDFPQYDIEGLDYVIVDYWDVEKDRGPVG